MAPRKNVFKLFGTRIKNLARQPFFWAVSILGNGLILMGTVIFHALEYELHDDLTWIDSLSWAIGLVTTIGYGDILPLSDGGKILGIFMMLGGTLFLWSYMAILVSALLAPELSTIEKDITSDDKKLAELNLKMDEILRKLSAK